MYNIVIPVYATILFFILSPGVLLTLPPGGSTMIVALVHSLVFFILFFFTHRFVYQLVTHFPRHPEGLKMRDSKTNEKKMKNKQPNQFLKNLP